MLTSNPQAFTSLRAEHHQFFLGFCEAFPSLHAFLPSIQVWDEFLFQPLYNICTCIIMYTITNLLTVTLHNPTVYLTFSLKSDADL